MLKKIKKYFIYTESTLNEPTSTLRSDAKKTYDRFVRRTLSTGTDTAIPKKTLYFLRKRVVPIRVRRMLQMILLVPFV
ncbi:hypothetical protein ACE1TH_05045 [Shouchella sp. JSM 1781072]|uniref:hypothetical protein n=1 Tax=Shouchella sp. JSM 1781072 TaxID=3344581 RepID=UPI0035BF35BA